MSNESAYLLNQIAALEKRIAALENKPVIACDHNAPRIAIQRIPGDITSGVVAGCSKCNLPLETSPIQGAYISDGTEGCLTSAAHMLRAEREGTEIIYVSEEDGVHSHSYSRDSGWMDASK